MKFGGIVNKKTIIYCGFLLLLIFYLSSMASATYCRDEVGYKDIAEKVFTSNYFNGTIVDKYIPLSGDYRTYLVDVNGTTFYLIYNIHDYKREFKVGDKVTIYGSAVNHEDNMHKMHSYEFNGKYDSREFPRIYLGDIDNGIRLAERGGSSSPTKLPSTDMEILKSTITNGNPKYEQTNCTVYVGEKYSGDKVHISVLYIKNGKELNQGNIIPKNVSNSGKISVPTAYPLKKYPEKALIIIYDENKKPVDAKIATLSKTSKPQHSKYNEGKSFKDCKNYFSDASDEVVANVMDECDSQGDAYLNESEFKKFKDLVEFTREHAANKKNHDKVNNVNKWLGKGTTKTRYCADHGRVAVGEDNKCPWCIKYGNDPVTKSDSTEYVFDLKQI